MIVIIPPTNAQLFFIIYICVCVCVCVCVYLAYMFRPYPVIIRALRYTKYNTISNCAFVGGIITIIRENARNNTY
jgi:hypothetical protein